MTPEHMEPHETTERPVFQPSGRDPQYGRRYARWAIWGCGGILLAAMLLFLGFMLVTLRGPNGKLLLTASENVAVCQEHLTAVSGAMDRYYRDKGRAPERLEDLYPTYLADAANLQCLSDTSGAKVSYLYREDVAWGKGDDIIVFCPHHRVPVSIRGVSERDRPYVLLFIRQDGRTGRMSATIAQIEALGPPRPRTTPAVK